jgi:hypothetical protein
MEQFALRAYIACSKIKDFDKQLKKPTLQGQLIILNNEFFTYSLLAKTNRPWRPVNQKVKHV